VDEFDVDKAIWLMRVSTQKSATDPRTGQIDMDALSTGTTVSAGSAGSGRVASSAIMFVLQASSRARAHDILRNIRSFLQTQTRSNVPLRDVLEMLRTTMPQDNISDQDVRK
jgi:DNA replicative helicase MCM subunit Mcm2 (Cdc46/Mcm family)